MDVRKRNMHPLPTGQHFSSVRTDDDITAAVNQFLTDEGSKLHGKTWQDTTAEVTKWLGSQIQQEREGWRHKTRAAMQEIENHRKEVLKYQSLVQECTEQMRLLAECCNLPEDTLKALQDKTPKESLPMYIEHVTDTLNALMEDRIMCLQILRAEDKPPGTPLPSLLKTYIESLKLHSEKAHKEARTRLDSLEVANKHSVGEMQRMKKAIQRKQEEVEHLHAKLKEIKDVTLKSLKDVKDSASKQDIFIDKDSDGKNSLTEAPAAKKAGNTDRHSTPSSLYSAPTPIPVIDKQNIQISEEKLSKLRRSAKKLENSLNDALTQMDTYRKGTKATKVNTTGHFGIKPYGLINDLPSHLKKEMKLLPSPLHMWSTKFEVSGPNIRDSDLDQIKKQEQDKQEKKQRAKERRKEALIKSQEKLVNSDAPTFRSLMKSLDDVKKSKTKSFKPVGQVTKCLRCNKLFTLNDNHKKACNYHPKGKERIEQYSDKGKLVKVSYVWKCCMMGPDNPGCTYGQHV